MVDIFKREICNYCINNEKEYCKYKIIGTERDMLKTYKCIQYKKDPSKIIQTKPPLSITAKRDYIKYHEI